MSTRFARLLTLAGFFGLLAWVLLWHLWLSPHPDLAPWLLPVIWTVPLLFPLKGIVQGNPYTHAWGNFVLMPYFLHALTLITTDEGERWLAVVLEHNGCLPDWLCPVAVGVCPVGQDQEAMAAGVVAKLKAVGVRAVLSAGDPLNKRLRDLAEAKVPVWAVIGAREANSGQISVRRHDGKPEVKAVDDWVEEMAQALRH